MKRIIIFLGLIFGACAAPAQGGTAELIRLGGILGENGIFALQDSQITVYSDKTIYLQSGPDLVSRGVDHDGAVSIKVLDGGMRTISTHLPRAQAHEFQLCDAGDQIWSPGVVGMSAVLPKGTKIKEIDKVDDHLWLVLAAVPTGDWPNITIFLLRQDTRYHFSILQSDIVSGHGSSYCGTQFLDRDTRAILVNEVLGNDNSNFSAIYLYQIRKGEPGSPNAAKKPNK